MHHDTGGTRAVFYSTVPYILLPVALYTVVYSLLTGLEFNTSGLTAG